MNLALAALWLMLSKAPSLTDFFIGYAIGFLLVALFSKLIGGSGYTRRTLGFLRFLALFLLEFLKANINVAYLVLFVPNSKITPAFFDYDVQELTKGEALFLAQCITLTPGTITVDYDEEKRRLKIHCLDYSDPSSVRDSITERLLKPMLRFTR